MRHLASHQRAPECPKEKRMSHKYTIEALRELISVHRDSEQAFDLCAASLGAERRKAAALLQQRGIAVIDVPAAELTVSLINAYIDVKARNLL